uniref:Uncharacterized protein n=1 Tax=Chlamydomonas leiostraca TaxID=1034604 RepID=A0A7S0R753_9CHLO
MLYATQERMAKKGGSCAWPTVLFSSAGGSGTAVAPAVSGATGAGAGVAGAGVAAGGCAVLSAFASAFAMEVAVAWADAMGLVMMHITAARANRPGSMGAR